MVGSADGGSGRGLEGPCRESRHFIAEKRESCWWQESGPRSTHADLSSGVYPELKSSRSR